MRPPSYKAVVDEFAGAIRSGALPAGSRLPTHRALARERRIALATATRVYAELAAMGLVVGSRGGDVRPRAGRLRRARTLARAVRAPGGGPVVQPAPGPGQAGLLRQALRALAATGDAGALLYQHPPGGRRRDRAAVATYLLDRGSTPRRRTSC
ncbi:GntR family transcriptional regulator [Streptomyces diastatochromogenes]|nr:GntR family transcriptional regulator [Streptomyces diastatochromogenes]